MHGAVSDEIRNQMTCFGATRRMEEWQARFVVGFGTFLAATANRQGVEFIAGGFNMRKLPVKPSWRRAPRLEMLESRVVMSTFHVNTTLDTTAVNLRTGADSTGHVSLRSAIMAANAHRGSDVIKLGKGTFVLSIAGADEDASATGDLDITGNLKIQGSSSRNTIIDANNLDRVFELFGGSIAISGVAIRHGQANTGGGILNEGRPGDAFVRRCRAGKRAGRRPAEPKGHRPLATRAEGKAETGWRHSGVELITRPGRSRY